jgi:CheY-like chemotaxis protein
LNSQGSKPTILVAEDDKEDQEILLFAFSKITDNHHLKMVENGRELMDSLSAMEDHELPCLIVLDYNMPELNGKQTLKLLQLQLRYKEIPKIIFTTSKSQFERLDCLSIGANDYLIKPADLNDIINSARQMLNHCKSSS